MSVDFGADISTPGVKDLDPYFSFVTGGELVGQALARRLVTPRGALALIGDDASYGYDVRAHLNDDSPNVQAIEAAVVEQLLLDERVESARATVTFNTTAESLRVDVLGRTGAGPFRFVLEVSAVTAKLLATETP